MMEPIVHKLKKLSRSGQITNYQKWQKGVVIKDVHHWTAHVSFTMNKIDHEYESEQRLTKADARENLESILESVKLPAVTKKTAPFEVKLLYQGGRDDSRFFTVVVGDIVKEDLLETDLNKVIKRLAYETNYYH